MRKGGTSGTKQQDVRTTDYEQSVQLHRPTKDMIERNKLPGSHELPGPPSRANLRTMLGPISSYSALVWQ